MQPQEISIKALIGSPYATDANDGELLYRHLALHTAENRTVEVSFEGLELVTPAFTNASFGRLILEGGVEDFELLVREVGISTPWRALLLETKRNAQRQREERIFGIVCPNPPASPPTRRAIPSLLPQPSSMRTPSLKPYWLRPS